ncbi:MAG: lamin tail domain-containing protein, partial [Phycisphaerales bacterium]|nr:lamin tail domain-containing protein [Phycisphaerales bacterium]
ALILMLAAPAQSQPVISEFMAENDKTLADGDGQYSDWIELHNPDPVEVNLAGWYLTDDSKNLTKWQFPAVTIPAGGYFVVFASDKDRRDPAGELHTNFDLDADGEYLALVMPDGTTIVSQFAPKFPKQIDDVSYGVTQGFATGETPRNGYFRVASPGIRNGGVDSLVVVEKVTLSRLSGPFTGTISLSMSGAAEGQRIRYVMAPPDTGGAGVPEPTADSAEYTGSITISTSTIVRATVFSADNLQRGFTASGHYVRLATSGASRIDTFASQLPLIVIDTHGSGPLVKDGIERPAWLYAWNRPTSGNTALTNPPTAASSLTTNVRGSSSAEFPKKGFTIRLTDSNGKDDSVPLLGLPSFDTWVLVGPWTYDPTYLHNTIIYDLSNRMGRWAPRTQVVEAFLNTNGGDLDYGDYVGIYILTDALRIDKKRVDITSLSPKDLSGNAITGGYLMKFDVPDPEDFSFQTKRNYPGPPNALLVTSPKAEDLPQAQREYI